MSKIISGLAVFVLIVSCCSLTEAQIVNALGTPPFSSIGGGPFDQINLGNLNTHFEIPIVNKAGRGLPFKFSLTYDSLAWAPVTSGSTTSWQMLSNGGWHPTGTYTVATFDVTGPTSRTCNSLGTQYNYTEFRVKDFIDPMGVKHYVGVLLSNDTDVPCNPDKAFKQLLINDGSGMTVSVTTDGAGVTGSVKLLNGTGIGVGTTSWQDNNGNYISGAIDTLGQTALTITGTAPSNVTYTYTGPSGAASYVVKYYSPLTIQTAFHLQCSSVQDVTISNVYLVKEIDLPDFNATTNPNAKYTFTYEPTPSVPANTTGRIQSVTLPTGGQISYSYTDTSGKSVIECTDGTPQILTRTTSDGTTKYSRPTAAPWTTTVTDPLSNVTTYSFATNTNDQSHSHQFLRDQKKHHDALNGIHLLQRSLSSGNNCYFADHFYSRVLAGRYIGQSEENRDNIQHQRPGYEDRQL